MKLVPYNKLSLALIFATFIGLLTTTLTDQKLMESFFVHSSYYFISAITIIWIYFFTNFLKSIEFRFLRFNREHWVGITIAFILVGLIFLSVKPGFRVLSDETNLVAISKSMAFNKTIYNTTMGKSYYDIYWPINKEIPKRPLMFPFGVHILHVFLGYSYYNAFIFNGIVLWLLLISVFVVAKKFKDNLYGIGMMLIVVSQPIITTNATSAGFDLFSTFFLWIVLLSSYIFLRNPTNLNFAFLWANLILFANIRYESFIYHVVLTLIFVGFRIVKTSHWKAYPKLYLATPLLYLPLIWQFILKPNSRENPEDVALFSIKHFFKNLLELGNGMIDFQPFLPYATIYNLIAFSILIIIPIKILLNKSAKQKTFKKEIISVFGIALAINLIIVLSHFFGLYSHPSSARLFLVFILALSLVPLLICKIFPNFSSNYFLTMAITTFIIYHPVAIEGQFFSAQNLIRENKEVYRFFENKKDNRFLVITDTPGHQSILNQGSVNFHYANLHILELLKDLENHLIDEIYVIQKFRLRPKKQIHKNYKLAVPIFLKNLHEFQYNSNNIVRISKFYDPKSK
jgi:hypothetical protein